MSTTKRKQFVTDICGSDANFISQWATVPDASHTSPASMLQRLAKDEGGCTAGEDFQDHKSKVAPDWEIVRADNQEELETIKRKQLAMLRNVQAKLREHYRLGPE